MSIRSIKRSRDPIAIARHLLRRASAAAAALARIAARTGVHRRDQLKSAPETRRNSWRGTPRPRRFPAARAALPARCARTPAARRGTARRDARATARRACKRAPPPINAATEAVCCGLRNGLPKPRLGRLPAADSRLATSKASSLIERRQESGQPLGEQRFAGSRRPDHEQAVRAGGGDLERALGDELTAHLRRDRAARCRIGSPRVPAAATGTPSPRSASQTSSRWRGELDPGTGDPARLQALAVGRISSRRVRAPSTSDGSSFGVSRSSPDSASSP